MKRRVLLVLLLVVFLVPAAIVGHQLVSDPGSDVASVPVADAGAQVERGRYLARAGNCMACHTARGGAGYAGGRAIVTPFGRIYASNITPDRDTGIGTWTADDFWRALHNGKSKDGSFLYPAFPYPNYTKVTRADADALYAYLRTVAPVKQANREHELRFPYDRRLLLAFWRTLYFRPGSFVPEPDRSVEWNRGAYLVQGLGHCSACHTARNALGGTVADTDLAGGMIPMLDWYASSLTSHPKTGLGDWPAGDLATLLRHGVSQRGAVYGPMAEVVAGSLQHLTAQDVTSMALYLKSLPAHDAEPRGGAVKESGDEEAILKLGAKLYADHCASCHMKDGRGAPPAYPPLAGSRTLASHSPVNPIRIVLNGGYPPSTSGNPRPYGMPPFGFMLNDREIAAVVSYARRTWGQRQELVSPVDVARFRGSSIE